MEKQKRRRTNMKKTTLENLMEEYGANGFVIADAGNGSAGPCWVEWSDDVAQEYGDTPMFPATEDEMIDDTDEDYGTLSGAVNYALQEGATSVSHASNLIVSGEGDNPYRYRIIF
jgi:hypothetical protein